MNGIVNVTLERNSLHWQVEGTRVCFSPYQCFAVMDAESRALLGRLAAHLAGKPGLALWNGPLLEPLLERAPELRQKILHVITPEVGPVSGAVAGIPVCAPDALPGDVKTVFLCETRAVERMLAEEGLRDDLDVIDATVLSEIAFDVIPMRAWTPIARNIYPIKVPRIKFSGSTDMILLDCPARNLALMPNGLAYVHNALKRAGINLETFDLDIVAYHRFHIRRLFDEGGRIVLPSGRILPTDPWQAENYDLWDNPELLAYLAPIIEEAANEIIRARPRILGLSIQQCNEKCSRLLVNKVRAGLPDIVILVGGFSCYNADVGLRAFPEAEYMCIGEADLVVGPLVKRLAAGERPKDVPGVLSRHDTPGRMFVPAPMQHNLDQLDMPRYEWADLSIYRNYNGYQLVPIIASRGCRWSRCTFCAERFYWRIRSPQNFVDELEWLVEQGCTLFMFNESDLNGMPDKLLEICDEIIRRDIKVRLSGQLRIQKTSDRAFFDKLHAAGFVALRFGVDAFSENTLRLQKKGYTVDMVRQNLRDCWEAGIYTEVNWVIGVPGETDADCDEGVDLILENRRYIGRVANINPLILVNGSVYWIDPERYGIRFRTSKEQLYAENQRYVPADAWYSVEPYIDAQVRKERFERIVTKLYDSGFKMGAWVDQIVADVRSTDRGARAGGSYKAAPAAANDAPVLVHDLETHKVYRFKERWYAVPHELGEVDLAPAAEGKPIAGVLTAEDDTVLLVEIERTNKWADSRGQYDSQERQRQAGTLFRAGSAIGDEGEQVALAERPLIISLGGDYIAIDRDKLVAPSQLAWAYERITKAILPKKMRQELRSIWPSRHHAIARKKSDVAPRGLVQAVAGATRIGSGRSRIAVPQPIPGTDIVAARAISQDAKPTPLTSLHGYKLIEFDGLFYGVPDGMKVKWRETGSTSQSGIIIADDAQTVMRTIRERAGAEAGKQIRKSAERGSGPAGEVLHVPQLMASIEDYDIVSYEGFVYGLPKSLGPIDLAEVDVIGIEGVIRDVSRQVVENEIRDQIAARQQAAE
ncbi:B12-binding domain-containing radical SAM protein [Desertibaculum subflavum]|uniref:B12-binding domain-containing radical SAM protein n=1 Tax=Desertibaculum subflavum TaxID=2268458 RepID=UPI000E66F721